MAVIKEVDLVENTPQNFFETQRIVHRQSFSLHGEVFVAKSSVAGMLAIEIYGFKSDHEQTVHAGNPCPEFKLVGTNTFNWERF